MALDPDALAAEVADAFDLGAVRSMEQGGSGAAGRIWRLVTEHDEVAVKELFWVSNPGEVEPYAVREASFVEVARAAGVDAPAQRADRSGRYVSPLPSGVVRVADWVPGAPVKRGDLAAARWVGWVYATLLGLRFPLQGELLAPWFTEAPTASEWRELARRGRRHGSGWAADLDRQRRDLVELATLVGEPEDQRLAWSHTDLHAGNVHRRGARLTLFDWEDAGPVVPVFMLARILLDWSRRPKRGLAVVDVDRVAAIVAGFRTGGGEVVPTRLEDFGGLVAGTQNFLASQLRLTLDPALPVQLRDPAVRRVRRLLDRPLNRPLLDATLAAVAQADSAWR